MFEIEIDNRKVFVKVENKKHIKHCYLRVINKNQIQIKANMYFTKYDAIRLIEQKYDWIKKHINKTEKDSLNDDEFLYLGAIKKLDDYKIEDLDYFYKENIKQYIIPMIEKYSNKMKLYPTSIKFRKNKRTWGSCNYKNGLNFNYLLMKYPLDIMEYIVVHELAHIKHKNHSKDFWNLVNRYCPNYKSIEKKFKTLL